VRDLLTLSETEFAELLDDSMKRIGSGNQRHLTFDVSNIVQMSAGGKKYRNLALVFHAMMLANKRTTFEIPHIAYRRDPSVSIDEAIILALNERIGFAPLPPVPALITTQQIRSYLRLSLMEIGDLVKGIPSLVMRLREYANHIAWMIKEGATLSQEQKTFFMHMLVGRYSLSRLAGDTAYTPPQPMEMRTNDPTDIFNRIMSHTRPGPKMNYLKMVSNANMESLVGYFGLYAPQLIISAGIRTPFGGFSRLKMEKIETLDWDLQMQLLGSADAINAMQPYPSTHKLLNGNKEAPIPADLAFPSLQVGLDKGGVDDGPVVFVPDLPQVKPVWRGDGFLLQYFSEWRGRVLEIDNSSEILLDHMLRLPQWGDAQVARLSIDEWPIADLSFFDSPEGRKRLMPYDTKCHVFFVRGTEKKLQEADVDMRPYHLQLGTEIVKPALGEYYRPSRSELRVPRPDVARYIRARIGLNELDWIRSEPAIMISYNWYRMQALFDKPPMFVKASGESDLDALRRYIAMEVLGGGEA
jgi:hypothetical protein